MSANTELDQRVKELGLEYVMFFQDTNPLAFRAMASCLGVDVADESADGGMAGLGMKSVAVHSGIR